MILLDTKKRHFKVINIIVVYAIILNITIPSAQAMNTLMSENYFKALIPAQMDTIFSAKPSEIAENSTMEKPSYIQKQQLSMPSSGTVAGGGQAETSGFSISSTDGMVNKFTGDFSYSIPLGDVEGYPLVLQYNSNVSMNSDPSWVGLGWSFNVGDVSREMRGLPDEFNGDQTINRTFNQDKDQTTGTKRGVYVAAGLKFSEDKGFNIGGQLTMLLGAYNNNYIGTGTTFDLSLNGKVGMFADKVGLDIGPTFGLGYHSDSKRGIGTNKSAGLSGTIGNSFTGGGQVTFGNSFHSRAGLTDKTQGFSVDGGYKGANGGGEFSVGATQTFPYGTKTMLPSVKLNSAGYSTNLTFDNFAGEEIGLSYTRIGVIKEYYYNENDISVTSAHQIVQPAIGYFHNGKRSAWTVLEANKNTTTTPLMDFNRSNDFEYSEEMKNLAFSFQTYDIFSVNALGIGATFRGRRNDVGTYYDPKSTISNVGVGLEVTKGSMIGDVPVPLTVTTTLGLGVPYNNGETISDNFKTGTSNVLEFKPEAKGTAFDQSIYFKAIGEMTPESMADLNALGGYDPSFVKVVTSPNGKVVELANTLVTSSGTETSINSTDINLSTIPYRAEYYKPFTVAEYVAIESTYKSLTAFGPTMYSSGVASIPRQNGINDPNLTRASNHISAIEAVSTDGMKYVFGIPAYDIINTQVSFCADGLTETNGVTTYSTGDDTEFTTRGVSDYFDKTVVPAYAHSFLLTQMVSSDYVDRGNAGLSSDDIGSYYKFNHTRLYSDIDPYLWKFPMGTNKAMMSKGNLGTSQDDMANYSYGAKEIWYTHSVESKNMIAEFTLSDRDDGYGVTGIAGDINLTKPLKKLDKITIYNRSERMGPNGATAVPLQTIEFEYSYDLCKNNPSNKNTVTNTGKLTLNTIRSYGGASSEMGAYSYTFTYDAANNKDFSYGNMDEWGNYKAPIGTKPNDLFPYADQTAAAADANSKAWKLIKIKNPMGGTIEVDYESDTYATVQDNRAMKHVDLYKMTNLLDFMKIQSGTTWDGSGSYVSTNFNSNYGDDNGVKNSLAGWTTTNFNDFKDLFLKRGKKNGTYKHLFGEIDPVMFPNNVIIFPLDTPINSTTYTKTTASNLVKDWYFTNSFNDGGKEVINEVYFKLMVNVKSGIEELVPVFGKIMTDQTDVFANTLPSGISDDFLSIGVMPAYGGNYNYGYVVIEPANESKKKDKGDDDLSKGQTQINSLQKSSLEYIRRNLPDKLYGTCPSCDADRDLDRAVIMGGNINLEMNKRAWAQSFNPNTTVKLFVSTNKKYGGNGRVKSIIYKDNWDIISAETTNSGIYQWNYKYGDNTISTYGNAAFEPRQGIDESPLYLWDTYTNMNKKFPDETKFTPTPIAVELFPAPIVGYEQIEVSYNSSVVNGKSISKFYTSRQYPFYEKAGPIQKAVHIDKPEMLITGRTTDLYGYSQGIVVRTNNFHGQPKEMVITKMNLDNGTQLQSRTTYRYANIGETIKMIDRSSTSLSDENVAQEIDIHADSRNTTSLFENITGGLSLKLKYVPGVPAPVVYVLPNFSHSKRVQQFNSHALVKQINQSAIVKSIETEYLGSVNTAENLMYDKYTGNVILSSLKDEFNDELYSLSYPAHWYYEELREKSNTENTTVSATLTSGGELTSSNVRDLLTPGDKVQLMSVSGTPIVYVAKAYPTPTNGYLYLIDNLGNNAGAMYSITTGVHQIKILKSNRDNRLGETMQSVVTKKNPLNTTSTIITFPTTEVIEAGAITYKDKNYYQCAGATRYNEVKIGDKVNAYLYGTRGDLVMEGQFSWQSERSNTTNPHKTRFDGAYLNTFTPIYTLNSGKWDKISDANLATHANWRQMGEVTTFNQFGKPLESRDQIKVYSSVVYGYNNNYELVPVAQAVNARQQEIAFDGFEDYGYLSTEINITSESHFDYKTAINGSTIVLDNTARHSGLQSLKIGENITANVTKKVSTACIADDIIDPIKTYNTINTCNCIKPFEPTAGDYTIGVWVKNDDPLSTANGAVVVTIAGGTPSTTTYYPSGPVIDGWQRLDVKITIPANATTITVGLKNTSTTTTVNFDDLRIHPFLAGMTTVVYDPKTLLPMATHDGYNFTTFYNYDENLNQVRMKVETVEGIKTVSETESGGFKNKKN